MTDKTIEKCREIGGDYFVLIKSYRSPYKLEHYLTFDPNDYWIYKATDHQREVSYKEFIDFNYSGYIFFKKSKYNNKPYSLACEIICLKSSSLFD